MYCSWRLQVSPIRLFVHEKTYCSKKIAIAEWRFHFLQKFFLCLLASCCIISDDEKLNVGDDAADFQTLRASKTSWWPSVIAQSCWMMPPEKVFQGRRGDLSYMAGVLLIEAVFILKVFLSCPIASKVCACKRLFYVVCTEIREELSYILLVWIYIARFRDLEVATSTLQCFIFCQLIAVDFDKLEAAIWGCWLWRRIYCYYWRLGGSCRRTWVAGHGCSMHYVYACLTGNSRLSE